MLRLRLLGDFELTDEAGRRLELSSRKDAALLAYLALQDHPVDRSVISGLLWHDRAEEQARKSLRQSLVALRRVLNQEKDILPATRAQRIQLEFSDLLVDAREFEHAALTKDARLATSLYGDALLANFRPPTSMFGDWLTVERTRYLGLACGAFGDLAQAQIDDGEFVAAIETARTMIRINPLDEHGHRLLMRSLDAANRRNEALQQYHLLRELLRQELDVRPDGETATLYKCLKGDAEKSVPTSASREQPSKGDASTLPGNSLFPRDKPSIAVLPFDNMSRDPEQEFFSDGITEDIITELSRYRSLFVIARNSSFAYKHKAVDARQVGRELGVLYLLEGSVRKAGHRVRTAVQLIDAVTGGHIWAERYDDALDDIFRVQDDVAKRVVAALPGQLEAAGLERVRRKPTNNLDAYEFLLRARDYHHRNTKESNAKAFEFADLAAKFDPEYSEAYAWKACAIGQAIREGYRQLTDELTEESLKYVRRALELDSDDTEAHRITCRIRLMLKQFDRSEFHLDRALSLNPNDPRLIVQKGINLTWFGQPEEAVSWIHEAMRRDPYHEGLYSFDLGCAYFVSHEYEQAMAAFKRTGNPGLQHNLYMAGCSAQMDDAKAANTYVSEVLRLKCGFSTDEYVKSLPYKKQSDFDHHRQALAKAGLPK